MAESYDGEICHGVIFAPIFTKVGKLVPKILMPLVKSRNRQTDRQNKQEAREQGL
jgi:hypothetical protein